jgi:hypothetical protein
MINKQTTPIKNPVIVHDTTSMYSTCLNPRVLQIATKIDESLGKDNSNIYPGLLKDTSHTRWRRCKPSPWLIDIGRFMKAPLAWPRMWEFKWNCHSISSYHHESALYISLENSHHSLPASVSSALVRVHKTVQLRPLPVEHGIFHD